MLPAEAGLELMPRLPPQDERQPDGVQTQDLEQTLVRLRPRQEDHRLLRRQVGGKSQRGNFISGTFAAVVASW